MSALPKKRYSLEEYLALEEKAEYKSEFYNGEIFAMAGATGNHVIICSNLNYRLRQALDGKPCHPLSNDMKVLIEASGLVTYPDVLVVCEPAEYTNETEYVLRNPRVIIEVSSKSTERYDRTVKMKQNQRIPSLMEYVIVSQYEAAVDRYVRTRDEWVHKETLGMETAVPLESLNVEIPMAQIYERVTFPQHDAG